MLVNGKHYRTVWFEKDKIKMINQLVLPHKFEITELKSTNDVALAITSMVVRGAPAIGATGAYGMALAVIKGERPDKAAEVLRNTRPTAQDLFHGIDYILDNIRNTDDSQKKNVALKAAEDYANWSVEACKTIGEHGAGLIKDGFRISTHCNAGWLATVDWGTALSPIYAAKRQKKRIEVYVNETRPRLQGANLTAWELLNEGIAHYVIADNALGYYMKKGEIDLMIVGSDRVARNGDFANKIGTYEKAVIAKENGVPFYVAVPSTTIDLAAENGSKIPIEERDEGEVHFVGKERITPEKSKAKNPAFDVTPARFVTGFITERGIHKPEELANIFSKKGS
jgi:S-methyl-5-thioribose-1-phosphate isomerase